MRKRHHDGVLWTAILGFHFFFFFQPYTNLFEKSTTNSKDGHEVVRRR